ncbi:hypothetical protein [Alkalitalea saponilacus]|uniref:Predicted Fe-Mo cluster-binding protein, NifX family n=1 Tax=Alkalitalea saponilacus TaxID=889453 RepID=A0A1T5GRF8_9BACT|nr:hypothetical protein [Alkalitalea saponilacus]ASB48217.1 hypothetical protein CDL62_03200 [Alkalitalea saponilacus]SKC10920.1 Predicted Fe-Mo cluster-binding protein, NifX family [Alkalitalea saponilacus]
MKVFIPVIDCSRNRYTIAENFETSGAICIFDIRDNLVTWYKSKGLSASYEEILEELKGDGVTKAIISSLQTPTINTFVNKGFHIYKSVGNDLRINLELLKIRCLPVFDYESAEELNEMSSFHSEFATYEPAICQN